MNNYQHISEVDEIQNVVGSLTDRPIFVHYYNPKDPRKRAMQSFFESQASRKKNCHFIMVDNSKISEEMTEPKADNTLECYMAGKFINSVVSDDRKMLSDHISTLVQKLQPTNRPAQRPMNNRMNPMMNPMMTNPMMNPMMNQMAYNPMQMQMQKKEDDDEEHHYPEIWVQYFVKTAWGSFPLTKPEKCEQSLNLPKEIPPAYNMFMQPSMQHMMESQPTPNVQPQNSTQQGVHNETPPKTSTSVSFHGARDNTHNISLHGARDNISLPALIEGQTYTILEETMVKGLPAYRVQLQDGSKKTVRLQQQ